MEITITYEVTDEQILNLLDEASRGSTYWCEGVVELAYESICKEVLEGKRHLVLKDSEKGNTHFFDIQNIKAGLKIMAMKYPKHFGDAFELGVDFTSDNNTGDVFMQCALLGEVIYG